MYHSGNFFLNIGERHLKWLGGKWWLQKVILTQRPELPPTHPYQHYCPFTLHRTKSNVIMNMYVDLRLRHLRESFTESLPKSKGMQNILARTNGHISNTMSPDYFKLPPPERKQPSVVVSGQLPNQCLLLTRHEKAGAFLLQLVKGEIICKLRSASLLIGSRRCDAP